MKKIFTILFILISGVFQIVQTQIQRKYEPIILKCDTLSDFQGFKIDHLYMFSYNAAMDQWQMVPFQFDEINLAGDEAEKYFLPDDSLLDEDDELVFMAADLGDKAERGSWVPGTDTLRIELAFYDSTDHSSGYVYLYHSDKTLGTIPDWYKMQYDAENDRVSSVNYVVGFNNTGQLGDVSIKSLSGEIGTDIFDRIKIRIYLSFFSFFLAADEDSVRLNRAYAKQGPVRVIRNMEGSFLYRPYFSEETFTQTSFFYPYNAWFKLIDIPIGQIKSVPGLKIDEFRVSWDYSSNAKNMFFYSEFNKQQTILIDGNKANDNVDITCYPNDLNWTMITGNEGTMLNIFYVPPFGDNIQLYYHEATDGSTGDYQSLLSYDTGDLLSYGDNGFSLINNIELYITKETAFNFVYYNFFLKKNFSPDSASLLCEKIRHPLGYNVTLEKSTSTSVMAKKNIMKPDGFYLVQNYPNPFNSSTTIKFGLIHDSYISLKIYDSLSRLVATLIDDNLRAGKYDIVWDGKDYNGNLLSSGIYFCRLTNRRDMVCRKLILIK